MLRRPVEIATQSSRSEMNYRIADMDEEDQIQSCHHPISLLEKAVATQGNGRPCSSCGEVIYVSSSISSFIVKWTLIPFGAMVGIALLDGGSKWIVVLMFLATQAVASLLDISRSPVVEHRFVDENGLRNTSLVGYTILAIAVAALSFALL